MKLWKDFALTQNSPVWKTRNINNNEKKKKKKKKEKKKTN